MTGARALRLEARPIPPAAGTHGAQAVPVVAATMTPIAFQAARAQLLLDRIAAVSDVTPGASDDPGTVDQLLRALDEREALLADLERVVSELSRVRGQLGGPRAATAEARMLDLVLEPVEQAAQRALGCQPMLLARMQAMRDELKREVRRLGHGGAEAHADPQDRTVPPSRPRAPVRPDLQR